MNILICPDSFKGSMTASQFCECAAAAIKKIKPDAAIKVQALADGGEGSLEAIYPLLSKPKYQSIDTVDAFHKKISASYILDNETAYIELAAASGYSRINANKRDVMKANTFGTGLIIKHAIQKGAKRIILFAGGSATIDGGTGILQALGYRLYDQKKQLIPYNTNALPLTATFDAAEAISIPDLVLAVDVNNPLSGRLGAARVYGPQKGATAIQIQELDDALNRWLQICKNASKNTPIETSGMGAAGGIAAVLPLTGGILCSGAELIIKISNLATKIEWADLVITGEGCFDEQSMMGKITGRVITLANGNHKPCIVICGKHIGQIKTSAGIYPLTRYCAEEKSIQQPMLCLKKTIQALLK